MLTSLNSGADMELAQWLAELGLGQYAAAFAENDIDFDLLVQLRDADLKELGISFTWKSQEVIGCYSRESASFVGLGLA